MKTELYWILETRFGRLAIMPRPCADEWLGDNIKAWRKAGVDVVVSLLTSSEIDELGLKDETKLCRDNHMEFISFPINDRQVPASLATTITLVKSIQDCLKRGESVAIHCRIGLGRSALLAACVLVAQGFEANIAFKAIGKARGFDVPDTIEQKNWVIRLEKSLFSNKS